MGWGGTLRRKGAEGDVPHIPIPDGLPPGVAVSGLKDVEPLSEQQLVDLLGSLGRFPPDRR